MGHALLRAFASPLLEDAARLVTACIAGWDHLAAANGTVIRLGIHSGGCEASRTRPDPGQPVPCRCDHPKEADVEVRPANCPPEVDARGYPSPCWPEGKPFPLTAEECLWLMKGYTIAPASGPMYVDAFYELPGNGLELIEGRVLLRRWHRSRSGAERRWPVKGAETACLDILQASLPRIGRSLTENPRSWPSARSGALSRTSCGAGRCGPALLPSGPAGDRSLPRTWASWA